MNIHLFFLIKILNDLLYKFVLILLMGHFHLILNFKEFELLKILNKKYHYFLMVFFLIIKINVDFVYMIHFILFFLHYLRNYNLKKHYPFMFEIFYIIIFAFITKISNLNIFKKYNLKNKNLLLCDLRFFFIVLLFF